MRGKILNNTIVSQTAFAIFRFSKGETGTAGVQSGNDQIDIANNLIVSTAGVPQYARNDAGAATIRFGKNLWAGSLKNSSAPGPGVPSFPQAGDPTATSGTGVLVTPTVTGLTGLADAKARYALAASSPARAAGDAATAAPRDILDATRSATAPSIGAFE